MSPRLSLLSTLTLTATMMWLVGCGGVRQHSTDWPNATPRQRGALDGDKPAGVWKSFHPDGSLASEGAFTNGRQNGRWEYGHPGGIPAGIGHWRDGIQHGWWTTFDPSNTLTAAGLMSEGRRVGPWIMNGQLRPFGTGILSSGNDTIVWAKDSHAALPSPAHVTWQVTATAALVIAQWDGPGSPWTETFANPLARALLVGAMPTSNPAATGSGNSVTNTAAEIVAATASTMVTGTSSAVAGTAIANPNLSGDEDLAPGAPGVELTPLPPVNTFNAVERIFGRWNRDGFVGNVRSSLAAAPNATAAANASNAPGRELIGKPLPQSRFPSSSGGIIDLSKPERTTAVVIMRGFSGSVCIYCASQTAALADAADDFKKANIDLVVIYPGPTNTIPAFVAAVQQLRNDPPAMPLALDVNLLLVRGLAIEDDLAKPTTLVLGRDGKIAWAYVGTSISDRPSVADILTAAKAAP